MLIVLRYLRGGVPRIPLIGAAPTNFRNCLAGAGPPPGSPSRTQRQIRVSRFATTAIAVVSFSAANSSGGLFAMRTPVSPPG
jgi:hypothetical protein